MTLECAICYEPFIMPCGIEEGIDDFNKRVCDKAAEYIESYDVSDKKKCRQIKYQLLKKYYSRIWFPTYKQYECSTVNCDTIICGICVKNIEFKSYSIIFKCTHCRLYDWKAYMKKYVFPELIMICLSQTTGNGLFSMRELATAGFLW
jgi:hypothetical protein